MLASDREQAWRRLSLSQQQFKEMKQVTTAAVSAILGKRPKMLKYLS
jgi:hypothetical protein